MQKPLFTCSGMGTPCYAWNSTVMVVKVAGASWLLVYAAVRQLRLGTAFSMLACSWDQAVHLATASTRSCQLAGVQWAAAGGNGKCRYGSSWAREMHALFFLFSWGWPQSWSCVQQLYMLVTDAWCAMRAVPLQCILHFLCCTRHAPSCMCVHAIILLGIGAWCSWFIYGTWLSCMQWQQHVRSIRDRGAAGQSSCFGHQAAETAGIVQLQPAAAMQHLYDQFRWVRQVIIWKGWMECLRRAQCMNKLSMESAWKMPEYIQLT